MPSIYPTTPTTMTATSPSGSPGGPSQLTNLTLTLDATVLRSWRDGSVYSLSNPHSPYFAMTLLISAWPSSFPTASEDHITDEFIKPPPLRSNQLLARSPHGKLKRDALYQLKGRFFLDPPPNPSSASDSPSPPSHSFPEDFPGTGYLHIDSATPFLGPGTIRSFLVPRFSLAGEVVSVLSPPTPTAALSPPPSPTSSTSRPKEKEKKIIMRWTTQDPYRCDMVYEQSCVLTVEKPAETLCNLDAGKLSNRTKGKLCSLEGVMRSSDHRRDWTCTDGRLVE